uniref:Peptidase S74 domain-containing protein n=1 Tax=Pithovirus LCPAC401 TaxID=2506595 RepID=A0A481ZAS7_9VIRU|nr:MAG: hypothetical protein LCPAC401_02130 [Pithovirus LCPAC401]
MQLSRWKYKDDENEYEHISPFSDDFKEFGLGANPTKIETIDLSGVLYACIKGLSERNQKLTERIKLIESHLFNQLTSSPI